MSAYQEMVELAKYWQGRAMDLEEALENAYEDYVDLSDAAAEIEIGIADQEVTIEELVADLRDEIRANMKAQDRIAVLESENRMLRDSREYLLKELQEIQTDLNEAANEKYKADDYTEYLEDVVRIKYAAVQLEDAGLTVVKSNGRHEIVSAYDWSQVFRLCLEGRAYLAPGSGPGFFTFVLREGDACRLPCWSPDE